MAERDGGPAFPEPVMSDHAGDVWESKAGMSLRDYFAGQVACGMAAFSGTAGVSYGPGQIAGRSYEVADAMLAERGKPDPIRVAAPELLTEASKVMALLDEHGADIVPHLLDTDDNPGQRLRAAIAKAKGGEG